MAEDFDKPLKGKKVDEDWKEAIEKEKTKSKEELFSKKPEGEKLHPKTLEVNFDSFISSLAMQAMIFLGLIPNPLTQNTETDLDQARYLINTIEMLKEKTKGNLTAGESHMIDNLLYELRMRYVEKSK